MCFFSIPSCQICFLNIFFYYNIHSWEMCKEGRGRHQFRKWFGCFYLQINFFALIFFLPHCFIELRSFAMSKPIFLIPIFRKHFSPFWHAAPRAIFQASFLGEMKWKKEINWLMSSFVVWSTVSVSGTKVDCWIIYISRVLVLTSMDPLTHVFLKETLVDNL